MVGLAGSAVSCGGARGAAIWTFDANLSEVFEVCRNASASGGVEVHLSEINRGVALKA